MGSTRIGLAIACCLFGFGVFANANQKTDDLNRSVELAEAFWDSRNDKSETAAQQQISAIWHTNDLLELQVLQDAAMQKRLMLVISAVGLGVVLAVGGVGISSSKKKKEDAQASLDSEEG